MNIFHFLLILLFSSVSFISKANDVAFLKDLIVSNGWSQALPAVAKNGVSYLTIENVSNLDMQLISVESSIAERVEIHEHRHIDGVMKMRKVEFVDIKTNSIAVFEPGGLHIMLIGLKQPLTADLTFPLSLKFKNAGELVITIKVH